MYTRLIKDRICMMSLLSYKPHHTCSHIFGIAWLTVQRLSCIVINCIKYIFVCKRVVSLLHGNREIILMGRDDLVPLTNCALFHPTAANLACCVSFIFAYNPNQKWLVAITRRRWDNNKVISKQLLWPFNTRNCFCYRFPLQ